MKRHRQKTALVTTWAKGLLVGEGNARRSTGRERRESVVVVERKNKEVNPHYTSLTSSIASKHQAPAQLVPED